MTSDARINARLPRELAARLAALQARTGKALTTMVTEALERYVDAAERTALERLTDAGLVAIGDGPVDLSSNTKRAFGESLAKKQRR